MVEIGPNEIYPKILPNESLIKIYIFVISFISIAYVVVKLKSFLYWFSIHENDPFWGFFGPSLLLILFDLVEALTRGNIQQEKHNVWKTLQNLAFWLQWNAAKVYSFGPFWSPIYHQKTKKITKNHNFCKNCILRNDL